MNKKLRRLTNIHLAFCAGLAICMGLCYYFSRPDFSASSSGLMVMTGLIFAFSTLILGLFLPGFVLSRFYIGDSDERGTVLSREQIDEAFSYYHTMKIIQWTMIESGGMVCGLFYLLSGHIQLLAGAGAVFLFTLVLRPSRMDFIKRMGLPMDQIQSLD